MCFGSNEPLPATAPDTDWICFYVDRSDQHLCAIFHVQVNNYNIYDVGILFCFYLQTAEMVLQLEEMAVSEKTGFWGSHVAKSTGVRGWGAERSVGC